MTEHGGAAARLCIVIDLDVGVIVSEDVLGTVMPITAGAWSGELHWPRWDPSDEDLRDASPPTGFERAPGVWGAFTSRAQGGTQVEVTRLGFTVDLDRAGISIPPADLAAGFAKGGEPVREAVQGWLARFCTAGSLILSQPLDLSDPSPQLVSRPSAQPMTWLELDGEASWIDTDTAITVVLPSESPWSERVADPSSVARVISLASSAAPVPSAVALLGAARVAALRGRLRLALMELGTCLEAVLTARLGLPAEHKQTLGPLTEAALKAGVPLPADVKSSFVDPRNRAVHNGVDPAPGVLVDAFAVLDRLVGEDFPEFEPITHGVVAHRPQKLDLVLVKPPAL